MGLVCLREPSTLEDLENFLQFLLPGGFFCLPRAHYENPGFGGTGAKNSNWSARNSKGVFLWALQQAIQIGHGIWSALELIWSQSQEGKWFNYIDSVIVDFPSRPFFIILMSFLDEVYSVSKKWGTCMVVVAEMIGKKESNSVKRGKWLSLPKCILLLMYLYSCLVFVTMKNIFSSLWMFIMLFSGFLNVNQGWCSEAAATTARRFWVCSGFLWI